MTNKKVYFATGNEAKVTSPRRIFAEYGIELEWVGDLDLPELQAETAAEIALGKIRSAFAQLGKPVMINDTSFHISSLGGFPGTYVKHATKQLGVQRFCDMLAGNVSWDDRKCQFVDAVMYLAPNLKQPLLAQRVEEGFISHVPSGTMSGTFKSPLARIFIPDGCPCPLAAMTDDEMAAYRSRPEMENHLRELAQQIVQSWPRGF